MVLSAIQNREAKGNVSSSDIENIIRQQINSIQGMIDLVGTSHPKAIVGLTEIAFYESLVPALLSEAEIKELVVESITQLNATGKQHRKQVINALRGHPGINDTIVSRIVTELLP